jgi:hypothetical protein
VGVADVTVPSDSARREFGDRERGLVERMPDGSLRWRCFEQGIEEAHLRFRILDLGTGNERLAIYMRTKEIVARMDAAKTKIREPRVSSKPRGALTQMAFQKNMEHSIPAVWTFVVRICWHSEYGAGSWRAVHIRGVQALAEGGLRVALVEQALWGYLK